MSNMNYCKFQNTLIDLRDCNDSLLEDVNADENKARLQLVRLCQEIVDTANMGLISHIEGVESKQEAMEEMLACLKRLERAYGEKLTLAGNDVRAVIANAEAALGKTSL